MPSKRHAASNLVIGAILPLNKAMIVTMTGFEQANIAGHILSFAPTSI